MIPFSILDLCPITEGGSPTESFRHSLDLALHAESWGYRRFWLAEHHSIPGIASAATSVVIAHIGAGTKIDNLVQIGHNVQIGKNCIIVAMSGISGSVTIEDFAVLAGAVGIAPHAVIGKGAVIAARSGVIGDVPAGETWGGYPARPRTQWLREQVALGRLVTAKGKNNGGR